MEPKEIIEKLLANIEKLLANIEKVIVGKEETVKLCLAALISKGHVLIEDVPGLGKTMLARSIAKSINAEFKRLQFQNTILSKKS